MDRRKHANTSSLMDPDASTKNRQPRSVVLTKAKGQFTSELKEMLYAHGDPKDLAPDPVTLDILEDILLEFLYDTCFHANRLTGSKSRLKVDDIRMVFRHDPLLLGRIEEIIQKEKQMGMARKLADVGNGDITGLAQLATAGDDVLDSISRSHSTSGNPSHTMTTNTTSTTNGSGPLTNLQNGPTTNGEDVDDDMDFERLMASLTGSSLASSDVSGSMTMFLGNHLSGPEMQGGQDEDVDLDGSLGTLFTSPNRKRKRKLSQSTRLSSASTRVKLSSDSCTTHDKDKDQNQAETQGETDDDDDNDDNDEVEDDNDNNDTESLPNDVPTIDPTLASILGHF